MHEEQGEAVLAAAVADARERWGERLLAAYALGSLAHGGFSALVSDVDLGLLLRDPLAPDGDAARLADLAAQVRATGLPLAERLSVFWGSPGSLRGESAAGRFPPLDRLDLLRHGRLLWGADARAGLPAPTADDLMLGGAAFAAHSLGTPAVAAELDDPAGLVAKGARPLTKRILFPVRFLYTARTGEIGRNHDAVAHLVANESGAVPALGAAALRWREAPPTADDPRAIALVAAGIKPLYRLLIDDHEPRLRAHGETALAEEYVRWRALLADAP